MAQTAFKNFSVRIPLPLVEKLDAMSKAQERPRGYFVRKAVEEFLKPGRDVKVKK
jgi:predicted DNA-binding protein